MSIVDGSLAWSNSNFTSIAYRLVSKNNPQTNVPKIMPLEPIVFNTDARAAVFFPKTKRYSFYLACL